MQTAENLHKQTIQDQTIDIVGINIKYYVNVDDPSNQSKVPCCKQKIQRYLINDVSTICKGGQVTAIMGASGAGKTTLLNILACRVDTNQLSGQIYANNEQFNEDRFGDFANYVMQNDILLQTLTVQQTLEFAANLKLNTTSEQKKQKIHLLVKQMKLQKCLNVPIGGTLLKGISGGQRKRTSIAFQLISDPQVVILDQPTSGLDSLTAFVIVRHLCFLAHKQKKTVIMTIHQPNSQIFRMFDRLILLIEGRAIYQGPANQAVKYFSDLGFICPQFSNPADYLMSIMHHESQINKSHYNLYFDSYQKQLKPIINKEIQLRKKQTILARIQQVSFFTTLFTLLKRDVINVLRNPIVLKGRVIQGIFISIYSGFVFYKVAEANFDSNSSLQSSAFRSVIGCLFFLTIALLMSAVAPVALTFPVEKQVFSKQRSARLYSVFSYFMSRNIIEMPYLIITPLIMSLILYWLVGFSSTPSQFFTFFLIMFLMSFAGASIGLLVGSVVGDPKLVSIIMPTALLPLIIFSGFFKNRGDLPAWIGWIQYISPNKYGMSAFVQNQFLYQPLAPIGQLQINVDLWASVGILVALSFGYRFLSFFFLWFFRTKLQ